MMVPYMLKPPRGRDWVSGDHCTVKLNYRSTGIIGGWKTYHYAAVILKVNKKTVRIARIGWDEDKLVSKESIF